MKHPIYEAADRRGIARAEIVEALGRYNKACADIGAKPTTAGFVDAYNRGKIKVPAEVRRTFPSLHHSSLRRWLKLDDLHPRYRGPTSMFARRSDLAAAVAEVMAANPGIDAPDLHAKIVEMGISNPPSLRTLQRHFKALSSTI